MLLFISARFKRFRFLFLISRYQRYSIDDWQARNTNKYNFTFTHAGPYDISLDDLESILKLEGLRIELISLSPLR